MAKHHRQKKQNVPKGFTIIEVMIVLALAGILMLVVLLAVPALQRNSRNFQRKHFAELATAQMENYYLHNRKYPASPTEYCSFIKKYLANSGDSTSCSTSIVDTTAHSSSDTPGHCVMGKVNAFAVCFHDNLEADHRYKGDPDTISIILSHWCLRPGVTGDGHINFNEDVIYSTDPSDRDFRKYAVWVALEKVNKPFCIDNDKSGF